MCGRYVSVQGDADLLAEFDAEVAERDAAADAPPEPSFNVAPTDRVRAIVNRPRRGSDGTPSGAPVRQLRAMTWGLVPSWSKERTGGAKMINARAESVPSKPAFKKAFAARRCLIPADGWYEWQRTENTSGAPVKQPFYMTPSDGSGLAFAGLYEFWSPHETDGSRGPTLTTCTIITVESVGVLSEIHDRMPLVLAPASWARWLDPAVADPADLLRAWDEATGIHLELRPVGSAVGNVKNNGPDLVRPIDLHPRPEQQALFS